MSFIELNLFTMQNGLHSCCKVPSHSYTTDNKKRRVHKRQQHTTQRTRGTLLVQAPAGMSSARLSLSLSLAYQIPFNGGNSNCVYNNAELFMSELQTYEWNTEQWKPTAPKQFKIKRKMPETERPNNNTTEPHKSTRFLQIVNVCSTRAHTMCRTLARIERTMFNMFVNLSRLINCFIIFLSFISSIYYYYLSSYISFGSGVFSVHRLKCAVLRSGPSSALMQSAIASRKVEMTESVRRKIDIPARASEPQAPELEFIY